MDLIGLPDKIEQLVQQFVQFWLQYWKIVIRSTLIGFSKAIYANWDASLILLITVLTLWFGCRALFKYIISSFRIPSHSIPVKQISETNEISTLDTLHQPEPYKGKINYN